MGTPLEHCNFSSLSIFPISDPLRATIIGTSSSYGAEHFWMGTPLEHCHFSSHSIFPISDPLRATINGTSSSYGEERNTFGWEHHLNIAISLAIQYFPSPIRSVPQSMVQAVPTERSGRLTLLNNNATPLRSAPCYTDEQ
jgi:hypothetical protein